MVELQKLFKSKFKQQALDGDSKYAKMNLEDSNPDNLPPPLRICALTIEQIKESFWHQELWISCIILSILKKNMKEIMESWNGQRKKFIHQYS